MANIKNSTSYTIVSGTDASDTITNDKSSASPTNVTINALGGKDSVDNYGEYVLINGGEGADYINNNCWWSSTKETGRGGNYSTINGGEGNDTIWNWHNYKVVINGDDGNDFIKNEQLNSDEATINGGEGNDTIRNLWDAANSYLNGDAGDDYILNYAPECTITGGKGNDTITLISSTKTKDNLIIYNDGDGNDIIQYFGTQNYLQIGDGYGTYYYQTTGSDISVYVGDGRIILQDMGTLDESKIIGIKSEPPTWKISGNIATYGNSTETRITINGVKSLDGITLNGSTVTIANSALNSSDVTINDGYYLALASDVTAPVTTAAAWTISGTTANYKSASNTAGYTLLNNQIVYTAASTSKNLVTVSGVKSASGLSLNDTTVTVKNSSLNQGTVTISDGYNLALGNDITQSTTTPASWNISGTTATYKASTNSAGYKLANNQITYTAAGGGNTLITVNGVKSLNGISLSGSTVTVANAALNKSNVTISNGYTLKLAEDVTAPVTTAAAWSINGNTATYKAASNTAGYKLANNQIVYTAAGGGNTLITVSGVKSTAGLSLSGSTVTIPNAALNQEKVTISDGYTLKLANNVPISQTTPAAWSINGTTATYKAASYTTGYKPENNQISYVTAGGGETLITLNGVNSTTGLSLSGSTVTVANSALNQGTVTINDGYYLALANDVPITSTTAAGWSLNGTTATYKASSTSAGYSLANNQIFYTSASGGEPLITVSGVKSLDGISLSGSVVIVANSALNNSNVTISDGYILALANDVPITSTTAAGWTLNNNVATYKAESTSAGYTLANNQIVYTSASGGNNLVTVSGIKSTDGININGTTVTLNADNLNKTAVTISNGYTLKLASDVKAPVATKAGWSKVSSGKATYTFDSTTEGYTLADNKVSYTAPIAPKSFTVSGIKSTDGITVNGTTVTVTAANLNKTEVTISDGYTLKLASDVAAPVATEAGWSAVSSGKATYNYDSTTEGYTLADNKVSYTAPIAAKSLKVSGIKSTDGIKVDDTTVTLNAANLNKKAVTISNGYTLALADDVTAPVATKAGWSKVSSGKATYTFDSTTAGYTLADNKITYTKAIAVKSFTVSGIKSTDGIKVDGTTITLKAANLNKTAVTISKGYTLALASDVDSPVATKANWSKVSSGKATYNYASTTEGYTLADNKVSYTAEIAPASFTLNGIKSTSGIEVDGTTVTLNAANLNKKAVTISDGYTLKLADDVKAPVHTEAGWSKVSSGKATYKFASTKAGYTLADNKISYTAATTGKSFKVSGIKSTDGITVKGTKVTLGADNLNKKTVTISDDSYSLALDKGVDKPTTKKAVWTLKSSTATYKSSYKTAGYTLAENKITYSKATTADTLATVKGAKATKGLSVSGSTIKLAKSALSSKVTVSGDYEFDFASDYKNATITGSGSSDTITTRGKNISVNGGKGDDTIEMLGTGTVTGGKGADIFYFDSSGANVISDYAAEDKISLASGTAKVTTSGKNAVFTVGKEKITVTGGADKTITYIEGGTEKIYPTVKINGKAITLTENYLEDKFNVSTYGNTLQTIDASEVTHDLTIIGNKLANKITGSSQDDTIDGGAGGDSIFGGKGADILKGGKGADSLWGGAGNDTLTGGAGADIFFYSKGDGKDLITDYAEEDSIKIVGDTVEKFTKKNDNVIFTLASKGTITIAKGTNKTITYTDADGEHIYPEPEVIEFNGKGTGVTLTSDYYKKEFDIADCKDHENNKDYKNAVTINGSAVNQDIEIIANQKNNKIYGGDGNDTISGGAGNDKIYGGKGADSLWGGKGDDTLYGGDGSDTFVYGKGDGNDVIADFTSIDQIMILSGKVKGYSVSKSNVTFNVDGGQITVTKGADKYIELVDKSGNYLTHYPSK